VVDTDDNPIPGNKVGWGTKASVLLGSYDCKYGRFATIKKIVVTDLVAPPEPENVEDATEEETL
jgi:hypothetical protein